MDRCRWIDADACARIPRAYVCPCVCPCAHVSVRVPMYLSVCLCVWTPCACPCVYESARVPTCHTRAHVPVHVPGVCPCVCPRAYVSGLHVSARVSMCLSLCPVSARVPCVRPGVRKRLPLVRKGAANSFVRSRHSFPHNLHGAYYLKDRERRP